MTNAIQRVLTALVGLPIVVAALVLGHAWFALLIGAASLLAQAEFYGLLRREGIQPFHAVGYGLSVLALARPFFPQEVVPLALGAFTLFICGLPFTKREHPVSDLGGTLAGVFYPVVLLSTLIDLRQGTWGAASQTEALWITASAFILVWAADTLAYYVGRSWGRRPLFPSVSPKKTWEGLLAGMVGAVLAAVALKIWALPRLPWAIWVVFALLAGFVAPLGDLAESRMKRSVGVKDSGTMLPGHGGMLDRVDALIIMSSLMLVTLAVWSAFF